MYVVGFIIRTSIVICRGYQFQQNSLRNTNRNVTVELLAFIPRIQEVPGTNLTWIMATQTHIRQEIDFLKSPVLFRHSTLPQIL